MWIYMVIIIRTVLFQMLRLLEPTMGGDTNSEFTKFLYFDMFLDGSIRSCRSSNNLMYFVGTLSQAWRNRETDPWPRPLTIANIELKFLHSLQCPAVYNIHNQDHVIFFISNNMLFDTEQIDKRN